MSLRDRIETCRRWTPEDYLPFLVEGRRVGRIRKDFAPQLRRFEEVFDLGAASVALKTRYADFESRSAALREVVLSLDAAGAIRRLRNEDYAVHADWSEPPLLRLERGAVPLFGTGGQGIHVNGFVREDDGLHLWVGRRAKDKATAPGKLDHIVAGELSEDRRNDDVVVLASGDQVVSAGVHDHVFALAGVDLVVTHGQSGRAQEEKVA